MHTALGEVGGSAWAIMRSTCVLALHCTIGLLCAVSAAGSLCTMGKFCYGGTCNAAAKPTTTAAAGATATTTATPTTAAAGTTAAVPGCDDATYGNKECHAAALERAKVATQKTMCPDLILDAKCMKSKGCWGVGTPKGVELKAICVVTADGAETLKVLDDTLPSCPASSCDGAAAAAATTAVATATACVKSDTAAIKTACTCASAVAASSSTRASLGGEKLPLGVVMLALVAYKF